MSRMEVNNTTSYWSQRQACSANNVSFQNFDHNMMDFGLYDDPDTLNDVEIPRMVKGAAEIKVNFDRQSPDSNSFDVTVTVENTKAGHKFPTDSPLRHLIRRGRRAAWLDKHGDGIARSLLTPCGECRGAERRGR